MLLAIDGGVAALMGRNWQIGDTSVILVIIMTDTSVI